MTYAISQITGWHSLVTHAITHFHGGLWIIFHASSSESTYESTYWRLHHIGRHCSSAAITQDGMQRLSSETEFQTELNLARHANRRSDRANLRRREVRVGQSKIGMVRDIEEICPELEVYALGEPEHLRYRCVDLHEFGTGHRRTGSGADMTRLGR